MHELASGYGEKARCFFRDAKRSFGLQGVEGDSHVLDGDAVVLMRRRFKRQALMYFLILLVVFALLGAGVYQVICGSVFRVVDESLLASRPVSALSAESAKELSGGAGAADNVERADLGVPALTTMADSVANSSFASIILLRDSEGALVDVEGLYATYPDVLRNVPFDAGSLDRIGECTLDGHSYRMISYRADMLGADQGADLDADDDDILYMQVLIGIDSEKAVVERAGAALAAYLVFAIAASAAAGIFFSKRVTSSVMASWRSQAEFVQNASHELKTPLAVIQASGEVLMGRPESKVVDCFEIVSAMTEESARMSRLVDNLMQLAASDAGRMELDLRPVDVDETVGLFAAPYAEFAEVQGKTFEVDARFNGTALLDADSFRQLLGILLDNALKYSEEGESVGIETRRHGSQLTLRVWDTGRGTTAEDRENAFKRFYRSDEVRAGSTDGMGLGLPLAEAIVRAHGGTIALEPLEPKGTSVVVVLPV